VTKIQTALGDHQDSVIARAELRRLAMRAFRAGQDTFTYGVLYERDAQAAAGYRHRAERAWHAASRPKYHKWLA
jgi:hypothetical protein